MEDITLTLEDINKIGLLGKLQDRYTIPLLDGLVRQISLLYPVKNIKKEKIPQERGPDQYRITMQLDAANMPLNPESLETALLNKIRWLEGLVIYLFERGDNLSPQDLALASQYLDTSRATKRKEESKSEAEIAELFTLVEADLNVSRQEILSNKKPRRIVQARSIVGYLMRQRHHLSYPDIGKRLGGKNHASVILAERKFRDGHPEGTYTKLSLKEAYNLAKSSYKAHQAE